MVTRTDQRVAEDSGLLTVTEPRAARERPAAGERLRKKLAELDELQGGEAQRRAEQRRQLEDSIREKSEERSRLLHEAEVLEEQVRDLRRQLEGLPDETSDRAQRISDRLGVFSGVLHAEVHRVDEMVAAYADYSAVHAQWTAELASTPDLAEKRKLVEFYEANPNTIDELDSILRSVIEQSLDEARAALAERGEPVRPPAAAPVYECVTPLAGGGSVAAVVIPAGCEATAAGHPHAVFVAEVLAAVSQALLELTDADAPVLICGDDRLPEAVVVGAPCTTDALDADLFGVRVLELLADSQLVGVEVLDPADGELAAGIGELVQWKADHR
jgi:hypothetical protein